MLLLPSAMVPTLLYIRSCAILKLFWGEKKVSPIKLQKYFLPSTFSKEHATKKVKVSVAQACLTLWDPMNLKPARLFCQWNSPGKNTGVGCHFQLKAADFQQSATNLNLVNTAVSQSVTDDHKV